MALSLALVGHAITAEMARRLFPPNASVRHGLSALYINPATGALRVAGDRVQNTALADTLTDIAEQGAVTLELCLLVLFRSILLPYVRCPGADGFYTGRRAEQIIRAIQSANGIMTLADLRAYKPIVRQPARGHFHGYEVLTVPPSSSGGAVLLNALIYWAIHGPGQTH